MIEYLLKDAEIKGFLEGILIDGGMLELDQEVRAQMLSDLYTALDGDLHQLILKNLNESAANDLTDLLEDRAETPQVQRFFTGAYSRYRCQNRRFTKRFQGLLRSALKLFSGTLNRIFGVYKMTNPAEGNDLRRQGERGADPGSQEGAREDDQRQEERGARPSANLSQRRRDDIANLSTLDAPRLARDSELHISFVDMKEFATLHASQEAAVNVNDYIAGRNPPGPDAGRLRRFGAACGRAFRQMTEQTARFFYTQQSLKSVR